MEKDCAGPPRAIEDTLQVEKRRLRGLNGPLPVIAAKTAVFYQWSRVEAMVLARELTKSYEEVLRGTVSEIQQQIGDRKLKGEITLVLSGKIRKKMSHGSTETEEDEEIP